ncbi:MAG: DNA adenine methylase [Planctomycetota bacterium]|nr:DNA adenine methylase [Blastopirellula sp.]
MSSVHSLPVARPFLKWVGGKSQLLGQFAELFPPALRADWRGRYFEPFLGGGALLFEFLERFRPATAFASDLNRDLVLCYQMIRDDLDSILAELRPLAEAYLEGDRTTRDGLFYAVREDFNRAEAGGNDSAHRARRASQLLFLNKTCFNGLYRVNRRGAFNTPSGAWKQNRPLICDEQNLRAVSAALRNVRLECAAYDWIEAQVGAGDFVYFDPPYRPLSPTSSFKSYTAGGFDDEQQRQLAACFARLAERGAMVMLSNSDPLSVDPADSFFDELYSGFRIHRVQASRMVNAKASGRGRISEIVVTNW